jgi:hypothetical protein
LYNEGAQLEGCDAVTIWIATEPGQSFSGENGQVDIWQYDVGEWGVAPALSLLVPPGSTGKSRVQLGTMLIDNPRGRLAPICNGIQVTAGNVLVDVLFSYARNAGKVPI